MVHGEVLGEAGTPCVSIRIQQSGREYKVKSQLRHKWTEWNRLVEAKPFELRLASGATLRVEPGEDVLLVDWLGKEARPSANERVRVAELRPHERVFIEGELVPPPPGVGTNAIVQASEAIPQASIEFTSDPNPLVRGHNRVTVTLHDSKGAPISGAQVRVSFYMAAMPAMGMAAMRAQGAADDQGNGAYAANIELPSGGTWSLTITASKGGNTIATKQVDVSASGSMAM